MARSLSTGPTRVRAAVWVERLPPEPISPPVLPPAGQQVRLPQPGLQWPSAQAPVFPKTRFAPSKKLPVLVGGTVSKPAFTVCVTEGAASVA